MEKQGFPRFHPEYITMLNTGFIKYASIIPASIVAINKVPTIIAFVL
ncbi:hypothetical protein HNV12_19570 [Methanococcoides sp. SA1]|nr:hypothetical protein [Methanococcoides sp. SA1]